MRTNRAVIVQCRLSSTRLPGKALKDLDGKPVLAWVLSSMQKIPADRYFVATDHDSFDTLLPICLKYGFECFAGDLNDVLKRFCDLIKILDMKTIIRATADNPFLFYEAAEESVKDFEERNEGKLRCDYLTWTGLPHGSGVEIFRADSLMQAATETDNPYDHEHVGPALYNHKDKYVCEFIKAPGKYNYPELRTTIDTYSDYLRALKINYYIKNYCESYKNSGNTKEPFTTEQIVEACKSNYVKNPVVLMPSTVKGHGTGHLHRCLSASVYKDFFIYIPKDNTLEETDSLLQQYYAKGLKKWQIISELPDQSYAPVLVTDLFELSENNLSAASKASALISIDEGSAHHHYCDYLLDIIPSFKLDRESNLNDSAFITKPENVRTSVIDRNSISKILICLGGEDPSGLTLPAVNEIRKCYPNAHITAIVKKSFKDFSEPDKTDFVENIENLREKIFEYELVITHYGLTAFEALYAGCGVILLPTTKLHKELAKKYGFAYIENKITNSSMMEALASENLFPKKFLSEENKNLSEFLHQLSNGKKMKCPVCDKENLKPDEIVSRNATRTYRRCQHCGIVYIAWTVEPEKKYQKQYFFEEYKNQYGKTYQEDFDSIKAQGTRRLKEIKTVAGSLKDKSLLDIGCAYGPFLSAAEDLKMTPYGTDISDDAVNYVQNELHIPATCSPFPNINTVEEFGVAQFDVVSMWYVIEHFKNLDEVLRKVSTLVKKGGIFAFSTPSGEGVSAKSDKNHFYEISPTDHFTVWEPSQAAKILKKYGFKIEKIVSTGHHPERFPSIKKSGAEKNSAQWKVIGQISKIKKLGDTMEIYCKRIK